MCSKHFKPDDFKWTPNRKTLKKGTVPSVFDWTAETTPRRTLKRKILSPKKKGKSDDCDETRKDSAKQQLSEPSCSYHPEEPETDLETEIKKVKLELQESENRCKQLKKQLKLEKFGIERFSTDDSLMLFYSGFATYKHFSCFYQCIESNARTMTSAYYQGTETVSLAGRKRNMLLIDELFLFLCRLRVGLMEQDLSVRFNCSLPTISRKIITWANFLYMVLGRIPIWLSRSAVDRTMPECFRALYPKTRVVIDCTEIRTQYPASLLLNSQMYSNYKGTCTLKCLLGVSPHGLITFISHLYTGCMSDVEICKLSGLLDLLEEGDDVMADKGFTIKKLLSERGVTLNIPAFLRGKGRFSQGEIIDTEQIAKLRIHVERVNRRIKEYHLFDSPVPLSLVGSVNQLWSVACLLSNFKGPIVQAWTRNKSTDIV